MPTQTTKKKQHLLVPVGLDFCAMSSRLPVTEKKGTFVITPIRRLSVGLL